MVDNATITRKKERRKKRIGRQHLCLDKGYNSVHEEQELIKRGSERLGAMQKSHLENYSPISALVSRNAINWCVVASAAPAWAAKIFPIYI